MAMHNINVQTGTSTSSGTDSSNVVGSGEHIVGAHETFIQVEQLQKGMCGVSRPHFFRGVATVSPQIIRLLLATVAAGSACVLLHAALQSTYKHP